MADEIIKTLKTLGWQPTSVLTYAFGSSFSRVIKKLHNEGKVQKVKNGWKAI